MEIGDKELGFAILGCGTIAPWHARAIAKVEGARLIAVVDSIEERARKMGEDYHVRFYTDYRDILERDDINVVNICLPPPMHMDVACTAAEAGKHILCEKPLEITLEKTDKIIEVAKCNKVKLGIVYQRRFCKSVQLAKKAIENGKLGKLISASAYLKYYRNQEYYDTISWRGSWGRSGGGCLMNQGIHGIDLLHYLMGNLQSVYSYTATVAHDNIEVEDVAIAFIEFTNGVRGVIEGSTSCYPGSPTTIEVYGQKGTIRIEEDRLTLWEFMEVTEEDRRIVKGQEKKGGQKFDRSDPQGVLAELGESHVTVIKDMLDAIVNDREPAVNGEEARKSVQTILSIYESAKKGKLVRLY